MACGSYAWLRTRRTDGIATVTIDHPPLRTAACGGCSRAAARPLEVERDLGAMIETYEE